MTFKAPQVLVTKSFTSESTLSAQVSLTPSKQVDTQESEVVFEMQRISSSGTVWRIAKKSSAVQFESTAPMRDGTPEKAKTMIVLKRIDIESCVRVGIERIVNRECINWLPLIGQRGKVLT